MAGTGLEHLLQNMVKENVEQESCNPIELPAVPEWETYPWNPGNYHYKQQNHTGEYRRGNWTVLVRFSNHVIWSLSGHWCRNQVQGRFQRCGYLGFLFIVSVLNINMLDVHCLVLKISVRVFLCMNLYTVLMAISTQIISIIHYIHSDATSVLQVWHLLLSPTVILLICSEIYLQICLGNLVLTLQAEMWGYERTFIPYYIRENPSQITPFIYRKAELTKPSFLKVHEYSAITVTWITT